MGEDGNLPAASELIYVPAPSWTPAFVAVGLTLVAVALFTNWVYGAFGAVLLIASLVRWILDTEHEVARMPLEQRAVTSVLPPTQSD